MTEFNQDIVSGSVLRSVWKLAWPTILLNLMNGLHGFIDHLLVGHFLDYNANAAIGVAWQNFLVIIVFIASLFNGMAVLVARYAGKQDRETLSKVVYETFLASILLQVFIVAPLGYMLSPTLLDLANAAPEVRAYALPFLRVMFTCSPPLFLMFMLTGALQASGNVKTPLLLGILTTGFMVILNAMLITGFGPAPKLGTTGAAIGTCVAPIPAIIVAIVLIYRGKTIIQPPKKLTLIPDFHMIRDIARIGIPTGIQAVLLNVGGAWLLRYIGSLDNSAAAQAAYTICYTQLFSFVTSIGFGLRAASSTIIGQNIGAGKTERGKHSVYLTTLIGIAWAVACGVVFFAVPHQLMALFGATKDPVLGYGIDLLRYLTFSGLFLVATLSLTGGLQGAGDTKTPMWIALITQIGVLLGFCEVFYRLDMLSTHVIWIAILVSHISRFALTYISFQRGHWTKARVEVTAR